MNIRVHVQGVVCLICGLALLGSLVHAQRSEAATYYVAMDGNDSNLGTEAQPFQTLDRGIRNLRAGDTLYVKNGTYTGSLVLINGPSGTSWDNPITIAAYPGHSPVIKTTPGENAMYLSYISYMVIDGFFIDGTNGNDGIKITVGSSHIRVQNSEIAYSLGSGIVTNHEADGNEFIHLRIHDNRAYAFYLASRNNIVEDCSIHDNGGYGVHVYNGSALNASNNIIRNSQIYDNGHVLGGTGIILSSGGGNQASNNVIWHNESGGIYINYGASNTYVGGNTIYENHDYGIFIGIESSNTFIDFNSIYGNYLSIIDYGISTQIIPQ